MKITIRKWSRGSHLTHLCFCYNSFPCSCKDFYQIYFYGKLEMWKVWVFCNDNCFLSIFCKVVGFCYQSLQVDQCRKEKEKTWLCTVCYMKLWSTVCTLSLRHESEDILAQQRHIVIHFINESDWAVTNSCLKLHFHCVLRYRNNEGKRLNCFSWSIYWQNTQTHIHSHTRLRWVPSGLYLGICNIFNLQSHSAANNGVITWVESMT